MAIEGIRQDRSCFYCGCPETSRAVVIHHAVKRSRDPSRIDDPKNHCPLCADCHDLTEQSEAFLKLIEKLWNLH